MHVSLFQVVDKTLTVTQSPQTTVHSNVLPVKGGRYFQGWATERAIYHPTALFYSLAFFYFSECVKISYA